jgi:hypothetical protein
MRSCILQGIVLSDHAPVLAELRRAPAERQSSIYRINNGHLKDAALQKIIDTT